jgi:signal transduction histidine kinase
LQRVVLNLVMNAIEAMSSVGGPARQLVISTRNVDPDQLQTKSGGMGMGLSISRSILQNHGRRLWATGNDGPGTSFHFTVAKYVAGASDAGVAGA